MPALRSPRSCSMPPARCGTQWERKARAASRGAVAMAHGYDRSGLLGKWERGETHGSAALEESTRVGRRRNGGIQDAAARRDHFVNGSRDVACLVRERVIFLE
jgi:hypothetical protein